MPYYSVLPFHSQVPALNPHDHVNELLALHLILYRTDTELLFSQSLLPHIKSQMVICVENIRLHLSRCVVLFFKYGGGRAKFMCTIIRPGAYATFYRRNYLVILLTETWQV